MTAFTQVASLPEAENLDEAPLRLAEPDAVVEPEAGVDAAAAPVATPVAAVVDDLPFAMPLSPRDKRQRDLAAAKAGQPPAWAPVFLDIALIIALIPGLLVAVGALGVKLGLLDLSLGYTLMARDWAPKLALLGVATGVLSLITALMVGFSKLWQRVLLVLVITAATIATMVGVDTAGGRAPPLHDVSTDWKTPLGFSDAALAARGGSSQAVEDDPSLPVGSVVFAGRRVADVNAETCPAARPLVLERSPADAYEAAKAAVLAAGLVLITDDPMDGRLEATGRTYWYGLVDDLVVRVRPDAAGARVDMRSISREGGPDLGRNCRRIETLATAIKG